MLKRAWVASTALAVATLLTWLSAQTPPARPATPSSGGQQQAERLGEVHRVKGDDIDTLLADGKVLLLDVREPWELEKFGTREGYVNIPLGELEKRLSELPRDKAILTA